VYVLSVSVAYLPTSDSQPLCDECKCSLTVKHILLGCYNLKNISEKYFTCSSLKELFENVDATTIVDFIKETFTILNSVCCFSFHFTLAIEALVLLKVFFTDLLI